MNPKKGFQKFQEPFREPLKVPQGALRTFSGTFSGIFEMVPYTGQAKNPLSTLVSKSVGHALLYCCIVCIVGKADNVCTLIFSWV